MSESIPISKPPPLNGKVSSHTRFRDDDLTAWRSSPDVMDARIMRGFQQGIRRAVRAIHSEGYSTFGTVDGRDGWVMPDGTFVEGAEPTRQEVEVTIRVLGPRRNRADAEPE